MEKTIEADTIKSRLVDCFKATCCKEWSREDIANDRLMRFAQSYLMMSEAKYRPAAPSDGLGNIQLTKAQCDDEDRLILEAVKYAAFFMKEDDSRTFRVGCSNFRTNRAFVLTIEAARLLAGGSEGDKLALRMLQLAINEIKKNS